MVSNARGSGGLTAYLSPFAAFALSVGCSVGWGAFVMPGTIFLPGAGPLGTLLGIALGAALMLVIGMNYHYLMQRYPDAGGAYAYVSRICNHDHGFLCAWFLVLAYVAVVWANASAFCLIGRNLLDGLFQAGGHYSVAGYDVYTGEIAVTLAALAALALVCLGGRRLASRINTLLAVVLLAGIAAGLAAVFAACPDATAKAFTPLFAEGTGRAAQVFGILALAPWAFVGFESISHSVEEFNFNRRRTIWILTAALAAGAFCYIGLTVIAASTVPPGCSGWNDYVARLGEYDGVEGLPVFYAVENAMGRYGVEILCFATFAAIATGLIGNLIAASRLLYAMSRDGIMPQWFSRLSADGAPRNAMLFIVALSLFVPFVGRTAIGWIVDVTTIGACVAYGYVSYCAFARARTEGRRLVMASGAAGLAASAAFTVYFLVPNLWSLGAFAPESYLVLAAWSIAGVLCFRRVIGMDREHRFGKTTVTWLVMIFLIFFTSLTWVKQATHRVAGEVMRRIGDFYAGGGQGAGSAGEGDFIGRQMSYVGDALMRYSLVQMVLVLLALVVMFSIYRHLSRRERRAEMSRVRAEARSRAKSTFLSNMSHDIRTPMNAIVGYTALAGRAGTTMEQMRAYLAKIGAASDHLLALINDILEMSRIESGRMELDPSAVDIAALVRGVYDMFMTQMESKGVAFLLDAGRLVHRHVMCDGNRLNRVLLNLVGNAMKFTPPGGTVELALAETGCEGGRAGYELRVKDSGIGMSPEFAAHVFDAFTRERTATVNSIEGTGLGMAIAKNLVELMGGTIKVDTERGKGTEFIIAVDFEVAPEPAAGSDASEKGAAQEIDFSGMKILLADDNEINREIASALLSDAGFEVDTAENGKVAVEKVAGGGPRRYDAVVMDVRMPVMGGYEAARAIRALGVEGVGDVPIVALSANALEDDVKAALAAGMDAHVAKPVRAQVLMETLSKVIASRRAGGSAANGRTEEKDAE